MEFSFRIAIQALLYLTFAEALKLRCPDRSQWNLRFRAFCKTSSKWYYCLFDKNSERYREVCSNQESFHKPGFKYIISGNLNGEPCDINRFQPFKFSMNGNSECVFLKSICTEDGQIWHNDGTTKTDITCRCDYTKGYAYVNIPKHTCYCDPTHEDCSCYKKSCEENEVLTADYECIKQDQWYREINCPFIKETRWNDNITVAVKPTHAVFLTSFLDLTRFNLMEHKEELAILIICLSMLFVLSIFLMVRATSQKTPGVYVCQANSIYEVKLPMDVCKASNTIQLSLTLSTKERKDKCDSNNRRKKKKSFFIKVEKEIEEKIQEELEERIEKRIEEGIEERIEKRIEEGIEERIEKRIEEGIEERIEKRIEEGIEERIEKRIEEGIEERIEKRINEYKQGSHSEKLHDDEEELRQKKIRDVHDQHIKDWERDDKKFVVTTATQKILDILQRDSCVLTVGHAGNGKSSIMRHIALKLRRQEQFEIIPIVFSPETVFEFRKRKRKQIFIVDDFCGKVNINAQSVDLWVSQINEIINWIDTSDKSDTKHVAEVKFLFATRLSIYKDSIFQKLKFLKNYVFKLSKCSLTDDEKLKMINKYITQEAEIKLVKKLKSDEAYFPLLCKIAERKTTDQIIKLFSNLKMFIKQDLLALKQNNNLQFCTITLCALLNNNFKEEILNDVYESDFERQAFENICFEFNLGSNKDVKSKIKEQLRNLEEMYMTKTENYYHFIHAKVYHIAVVVCGQTFLHSFIKYVRSSFIAERFCFQSKMDDNNKNIIIIDNEDAEKRYFDRLMFDLEQGETYSTFHNNQLTNKSYREKFCKYCQNRKQKVSEVLKHFSVNNEIKFAERNYDDYIDFKKQHHFFSHKMRKPLIESAWEGHADIVHFLLEFECDINESDKFGRTALFVACLLGKKEVVDVLLNNKADHSLCDDNKRSPLLVAAREGKNSIVEVLLQINADANLCDDKGNTPLLVASSDSPLGTVKILSRKKTDFSKCNNLGQTPVFVASMNGKEDVVRYLLSFHSEYISTPDNEGRSPLFIACSKGHRGVVKLLLENNADISQCDWNNRSPLFIASAAGYADIVHTLIQNKADINQRDEEGETPLFVASDRGHLATVTILVNSQADLNATDHRKSTPLYAACKRGFIKIVEILNENRASITQCNKWNESPLFAACRHGYIEIVRYLVENKSYISESDFSGTTPLLIACENGKTEIVDILIQSGADINQSDQCKKTPLHASAAEGHAAIVKFLINEGARTTLTNSENKTPLDLARNHSYTDIVKLLTSNK